MWDNTPRKLNRAIVLDGADPELFKNWLKYIINDMRANKRVDDNLIFLNVLNEWAEGAYIESDLKWKYGYLEAVRGAILQSREKDDMSAPQKKHINVIMFILRRLSKNVAISVCNIYYCYLE